MNATVTTYGLYLLIALPLTMWVARNLFRNGRIFLVDCFHGNESLADSVNQLLVVGFYLVNFGFVSLYLKLADDGRWWQGAAAWLTCLWTTWEYRAWAFRLAAPVFQPFVKKAVHLLSENRLTISRLFAVRDDGQLAAALNSMPSPNCTDNACHI